MFSAQQLQKFAGKKRITQETFDEAVKENIEEFEMEAEEAVASAVAEFQSQGVDLSNIITTATGGDMSNHPLTNTIKDLNAAIDSADHTVCQACLESLNEATLKTSSTSSSSDESRQFAVMANSLDAITAIIKALKLGTTDHDINTQIAASNALCALLPLSSDLKTSFLRAYGIEALAAALSQLLLLSSETETESGNNKSESTSTHHQRQRRLIAVLLQAAAASTLKNENNKCAAMEAKLGSLSLEILKLSSSSSGPFSTTHEHVSESDATSTTAAVVLAVCSVLSSLTTADDESLPSSRAFPNARQLAKEGAAEALVTALRIYTTSSTNSTSTREVVIGLCGTLRQIAANDEICQEAANTGAVPLALQLADSSLEIQDAGVLRAALNVLKQLASSDGIKAEIFEAGGLDTIKYSLKLSTDQIIDSVDTHNSNSTSTGAYVAVIEQSLGLLANITLRNPEISTAAVSGGCVVEVLRAMRALLDEYPAPLNGGKVDRRESSLRQGCMALRNIAARCPDDRHVLLAEGAEKLIREIKNKFPSSCQDVGSAALRDLGLEKYNN